MYGLAQKLKDIGIDVINMVNFDKAKINKSSTSIPFPGRLYSFIL